MKTNNYIRLIGKGRSMNLFFKSLLLFFLLIIHSETSYSDCCDPQIKSDGFYNRFLKYKCRDGNRCEGFYRDKVSTKNNIISVIGLIKGNFYFEMDKNEIIEVSSPLVKNKTVHVRAVGIPPETFYRMDATIHSGQKLSWPVKDVIIRSERELSYQKISVLGWIKKETETIYVPVSTASKMEPMPNDITIRLYLRTYIGVDNVIWRYSAINNNRPSKPCPWIKADKSHYDAGEPILIVLPSDQPSEELQIEVSAKEENRAAWLKTLNIHLIIK
ncbi:hypothetical protein QUF80_01025 [Desulfococcaceae bacterium HSG8]|nr:hypothetical protein [Desulfococcaceae bacterium HSG8]